jgi:hypothetical protein
MNVSDLWLDFADTHVIIFPIPPLGGKAMSTGRKKISKKKVRAVSLERLYTRYFRIPANFGKKSAGEESLEQPSPERIVPTITQYGLNNEVFRTVAAHA